MTNVSAVRFASALALALVASLGAACLNVMVGDPFTEIPRSAIDLGWGGDLERIEHAYYSGITGSERLVITDSAAWRTFWTRMHSNVQPQPALPAIDFHSTAVIAVALGQRNTGGYDIRVARAAESPTQLYVAVMSATPGSCGTTQALTQPVDVVRVPRPRGVVTFVERSEASC